MKIPANPENKIRALIVVDVQPAFLNKEDSRVVENILELLASEKYDLYVEASFHAEKGSLWDMQQDWICPEGAATKTVDKVSGKLGDLGAVKVKKETKSVFKGDKDIAAILRDKNIGEVHVVGLDTDDCVLATAHESFDLGFVTYVIEECCDSSSSKEAHEAALAILRGQNMTNNSVVER